MFGNSVNIVVLYLQESWSNKAKAPVKSTLLDALLYNTTMNNKLYFIHDNIHDMNKLISPWSLSLINQLVWLLNLYWNGLQTHRCIWCLQVYTHLLLLLHYWRHASWYKKYESIGRVDKFNSNELKWTLCE